MASGAAALLKIATVTACILLVLLPMATKPVMGVCSLTCETECDNFAANLCTGSATLDLSCVDLLKATCKTTAAAQCKLACNAICGVASIIKPCIP